MSLKPSKTGEYPDCPECQTDMWVVGRKGKAKGHFNCEKCGPFYKEP